MVSDEGKEDVRAIPVFSDLLNCMEGSTLCWDKEYQEKNHTQENSVSLT